MIYSMDNLRLAHKNARKGKGWYTEVKEVDEHEEEYLTLLQKMLMDKTYNTSEYVIFTKKEGNKCRQIYKLPYFPDRICQWAIMQVIEPILLKQLTTDTYSALPGKGIHLAKQRMERALRKDIPGTQYCLKLDVKKYYPSINHDILKAKYRKIFKDKDLLWLLDEIIDSTEGDTGIPIGNYLSQYSGNYYLSAFDHWIKEVKQVKYYFRYMDDICIFADSKKTLHALKDEIDKLFQSRLHLIIKDNWQVFPTYCRGIDYVGYRIFLNYSLLRKSTCLNFKRKMRSILKKELAGIQMNHSEWCSINSYHGWLKWCDSYHLQMKYLLPLQDYKNAYYIKNLKGKKHERDWQRHEYLKTGTD